MRILFPLLFAISLSAQTPYLVKDINTTYAHDVTSSTPVFHTAWHNRVYFVATLQNESGTELWSTDGTAAGTAIVSDILPGTPGSNPAGLSVVNDTLLFSARDVNHGIELWTTDGTAAGTRLLLDINPGPSSAQPSSGLVYRNRLYFVADDGTTGRELWSTDGTAAGTRLLRDLEPGIATSSPRAFVILGDTLYFLAGTGLWKTDGTDAGTVRVTTVNARNLAVAGNRIFFEGFTAETNWELWTSDGTEAGTRMVEEIRSGVAGAFTPNTSQPFTVLGNRVIFPATDDEHGREPWVSDGTAAGTHLLRDFKPGPEGAWNNLGMPITVFRGRAVFTAKDEEHGEELWSTDGTEAGTSFFLDVRPGPDSSVPYLPVVAGDKLFFIANGGTRRYESRLWVTDGTANGTRMLGTADGSDAAYYSSLRVIGDKVYFAGQTALTATEPWVSDGTTSGTHMIANLGADRAPSSSPRMFAATEQLVFFHATEGTIAESNSAEASLWRSDGTAEGTFKLRETGQHPSVLTGIGRYVFFAAEESRTRLMRSDGTLAGTHPDDALARYFENALGLRFFPFGDTLFVTTDSYPRSLWKTTTASPGDPAINLHVQDSVEIIDAGGGKYMFFGESPSFYDTALWISDGTPAGTYPVVPELTDATYGLSGLVNAGGTVYFVMQGRDEEKPRLWKSDGTFDGTVPVKELTFGPTVEIAAAGRRVYLTAPDALWTSDGTAEGTVELTKGEFRNPNYDEYLKPVGNRMLIHKLESGSGAAELWGSDGTVAGTKLLLHRDVNTPIAVIDGVGYFAHSDPQHGSEIWTTDGTVEGTKMLIDLSPGPASSSPSGFTKAGNLLYFSAFAEGTGAELWALPLNEARLAIADARAAESAAVVRFRVALEGPATQTVTVDYSTSNGSATAGQDYEAASGRLTFAPGETSKTVDVRLLADTSSENNETFVLALRNASGARIVRSDAAGIIEDDDLLADLSASMVFGGTSFGLTEVAVVTNHGPRGVTNVDVELTAVPGDEERACSSCTIPQLAAGASAQVYARDLSTDRQQYRSAIVHSRQTDGNPANNAVSWTVTAYQNMAMSPAYLRPGETATVAVEQDGPQFPIDPVSTDPSVLAISSPITKDENGVTRFTVTAAKVGSVRLAAGRNRLLNVDVIAAGTTPKWADAIQLDLSLTSTRFGTPLPFRIIPRGRAPLTGARPTGTVIVTANGQELARAVLAGADPVAIPVSFPAPGFFACQVSYSGDANFLPVVFTRSISVIRGLVSITGHLEKVPGVAQTYVAKIRVEGAPGYAPGGLVHVLHDTVVQGSGTLTPSPNGASTVEMTLQNLPDSPTVTVLYEGNTSYEQATQSIRLVEMRRRPVRH